MSFLLPRPPRITARFSQLVFQVIQPLTQLIYFLPLGVNFCINGVDIGARVLLFQRFLRVRVIFHLGLFQFASQKIKLLLGLCNLVALGLKLLSPRRLPIWIFGRGGFSGFGGGVASFDGCRGLRGVSRRWRCRRGSSASSI